jgi:pyridoxal 5'-phosphate synthase pdxS subunit
VVNFAAGGVSTPADAALMMQLGVDGIFVGSGVFKSQNPQRMAEAIVKATTHFNDAKIVADVSRGLGDAMAGLDVRTMPIEEQLATRGW